MLKVHAKKLDAVEFLCLEGRIVNGETEVLRSVVQLASDDTSEIVLDLSNVSVVDAHGLGVLLQLREQTLAREIHFELRNVSKPLYNVFEITRLNTVFEINSDVAFLPQFVYPLRTLVAA
jgi:anti-anti-sigma factor